MRTNHTDPMTAAAAEALPSLVIDEHRWTLIGEPGDPTARLHTTILINGHPFHVEAWKVVPDSDPQELVDDPEALDDLGELTGGSGPYDTQTILGSRYVVVALPYRN